ncbi:MAG: NAD(P)H-hydrate dehydratase [Clostridia bacterium]|nr:NAD(P)H-hydrate dehydratase [Clostridia bacterium]
MRLIEPSAVREIDGYIINNTSISEIELIGRAGKAVAEHIMDMLNDIPKRASVVFLIGSGNNGADGACAASLLSGECDITLVDMSFGREKSAGLLFYEERLRSLGIRSYEYSQSIHPAILSADIIVEAVFGSGVRYPLPEWFSNIADIMKLSGARLLAVDTPLGINALTGAVDNSTPHYDRTVCLSYIKCGTVSYPAKEYAGSVYLDTLGIQDIAEDILKEQRPRYYMTQRLAAELLPRRAENSSKGSFGRLLTYLGGDEFLGASLLAHGAALRCGAGYVTALGTAERNERLMQVFPEMIYKTVPAQGSLTDTDISGICEMSKRAAVTLIGCGCGNTEGLSRLVKGLLNTDGGILVLDADAINSLANCEGREALKRSQREVVLTPHPLELSRLSGIEVDKIQTDRMRIAERFAEEYSVTLVLKGAGTVTTDGRATFINSCGSSALAKAGSGDVLAGALASLLASGGCDTVTLCAIAVYLHASAGDALADTYSSYGVTPSDLPVQIAMEISRLEKLKQ